MKNIILILLIWGTMSAKTVIEGKHFNVKKSVKVFLDKTTWFKYTGFGEKRPITGGNAGYEFYNFLVHSEGKELSIHVKKGKFPDNIKAQGSGMGLTINIYAEKSSQLDVVITKQALDDQDQK